MSFRLVQEVRALVRRWVLISLVCVFASDSCRAHIVLGSPNGGESLVGGATFQVDWQIAIEHNTFNWDLWYSITSDDGPWLPIVEDLPIGEKAAGTSHSFDWTVPHIDASSAWVRVLQDNAGMDWDDVSDASFRIMTGAGGGDFTGDGSVDSQDLIVWESGFGAQAGAISAHGDADLDTDVDGADFLAWQGDYQAAAVTAAAQQVPEPAATIMLLLGLMCLFCIRRWYSCF